jgi:hypothetical protein
MIPAPDSIFGSGSAHRQSQASAACLTGQLLFCGRSRAGLSRASIRAFKRSRPCWGARPEAFAGAPHVGLTCGSLHRILASALSARQARAGGSRPGASNSIVRKYYRHSAAGLKQTVY